MRNSQTETDTAKALTIHTQNTPTTHSTPQLLRSALLWIPRLRSCAPMRREKELSSPSFTALTNNSTRVH
jgi:hypothetical protein